MYNLFLLVYLIVLGNFISDLQHVEIFFIIKFKTFNFVFDSWS